MTFVLTGTKPYIKMLVPLGILLILTYLPMFLSADVINLFTREDKIYETLSAVYFVITAPLYLLGYFRAGKYHAGTHTSYQRKSYLVLALLFLIFAGEEISWGQRVFHTGDSDLIRQINGQNETNIHNLKWIDGKGDDVIFPLSLLSSGNMFVIFTFSVYLVIPLAADLHKPTEQFFEPFMPHFPWPLSLLMILNLGLFHGVRIFFKTFPGLYHHSTRSLNWAMYEVAEHGAALILLTISAYLVFVTLAPPKSPATGHNSRTVLSVEDAIGKTKGLTVN